MGGQEFVRRHYTPLRALALLTITLYLIYIDRGILAGSATSIKGCVDSADECSAERASRTCGNTSGTHEPTGCASDCRICGTICSGAAVTQTGFGINNEQLAIAQSSFMAGYLGGCLTSAHFSQHFLPFRLMSIGLWLWCLSVLVSAAAGWLQEGVHANGITWAYVLLVVGRGCSGFGEAALSTLALPFLDNVLDADTKGFYIAVYYSAIPAGTALGLIYAGAVNAVTDGQWEWAFVLEVPAMLPLAILAFFVPFTVKRTANGEYFYDVGQEEVETELEGEPPQALAFWQNVKTCLMSTEFVYGVLGYAVYTGVAGGLQFYGPIFIQSYRPCDPRWAFSQVETDLIFGLMICFAGFFGTLVGGVVVDRLKAGAGGTRTLALLSVVEMVVACSCALILLTITYPPLFFTFFGLCLVALFAVSPAINLLVVRSVPARNGPMAVGLLTIGIHLLGDVPSPIIIGRISDSQTPLFTLAVTVGYLLLTIVFWARILLIRKPVAEEDEPLLQESS